MVSNLGDFFSNLQSKFEKLAIEAAEQAAKQGQQDIISKAKSYVNEYYGEYSPKMYHRLNALSNAIVPFYQSSSGGNGVSIEFGVTYTGDIGQHYSNSWYHQSGSGWVSRYQSSKQTATQDYGLPDSTWIVSQYLDGIHPWAMQGVSPDIKMQEFFDSVLPGMVQGYLSNYLLNAIGKLL